MIKIGVVPSCEYQESERSPFHIKYKVYAKFSEPIYKLGAIPIIIFPVNGEVSKNILDECDGFLLCGGTKIEDYYLEVINYAVSNNKPLLGICLGCQSLGVYSIVEDYLIDNNLDINIKNIKNSFKYLYDNKTMFLKPVDNHNVDKMTYDNLDKMSHLVNILKDTKLHAVYNSDTTYEVSMHNYAINMYGRNIKVVAKYEDTIEGIEYTNADFIIGVQYHPEYNEDLSIFKALIDKASK